MCCQEIRISPAVQSSDLAWLSNASTKNTALGPWGFMALFAGHAVHIESMTEIHTAKVILLSSLFLTNSTGIVHTWCMSLEIVSLHIRPICMYIYNIYRTELSLLIWCTFLLPFLPVVQNHSCRKSHPSWTWSICSPTEMRVLLCLSRRCRSSTNCKPLCCHPYRQLDQERCTWTAWTWWKGVLLDVLHKCDGILFRRPCTAPNCTTCPAVWIGVFVFVILWGCESPGKYEPDEDGQEERGHLLTYCPCSLFNLWAKRNAATYCCPDYVQHFGN